MSPAPAPERATRRAAGEPADKADAARHAPTSTPVIGPTTVPPWSLLASTSRSGTSISATPGEHPRLPEAQADEAAQRTFGPGDEPLRRRATSGDPVVVPEELSNVLRSSGEPLDAAALTLMETRFGHSFGDVRIHADAAAAKSATDVDAEAYTVGRHIVLAPGRYQPHTLPGRQLLAHELTHVVQQRGGYDHTTEPRQVSDPAGRAEVEAEAVSREVIPDQRPARPEPRAPVPVGLIFDHTPVIQRKPTTSQAGTVAQFIVVFNSTPSGMSQTTGQDAHNAMLRLGETEMSWTGPLPTTTPYFNQRPARYIYTTQGGWIDMVHFLFHAGRAYKYLVQQRDAARSLAEIEAMPWFSRMWLPSEYMDELYRRSGMSPIGESVQEGFQTEQLQSVVTPHSAYSYEDLPSDTFGARFAVQHFNPNARQSLGQQLAAYLNNVLGAVDPTRAPNYASMGAQEGPVDRQNLTTTPVYTATNP